MLWNMQSRCCSCHALSLVSLALEEATEKISIHLHRIGFVCHASQQQRYLTPEPVGHASHRKIPSQKLDDCCNCNENEKLNVSFHDHIMDSRRWNLKFCEVLCTSMLQLVNVAVYFPERF